MKTIKTPKLKTLSQKGAAHYIIPLIAFILLFAAAGTYILIRAHAATPAPKVAAANSTTTYNDSAWAGYGVTAGHFRKVESIVTVPAVSCADNPNVVRASWWDGITNSEQNITQLEQTGVELRCKGSEKIFTGFWQTSLSGVPNLVSRSALPISAGDQVRMVVTYLGTSGKNDRYEFVLNDETIGKVWSAIEIAKGGTTRTVAAWVTEGSYENYPFAGVTQSIPFTSDYAETGSVLRPISYFGGLGKYIINDSENGVDGIITPSALTNSGSSFTDTVTYTPPATPPPSD